MWFRELLPCWKVGSLLGQAAAVKARGSIRSLFSLPGFVALSPLAGVLGDRYARVIVLQRERERGAAGSAACVCVA